MLKLINFERVHYVLKVVYGMRVSSVVFFVHFLILHDLTCKQTSKSKIAVRKKP